MFSIKRNEPLIDTTQITKARHLLAQKLDNYHQGAGGKQRPIDANCFNVLCVSVDR